MVEYLGRFTIKSDQIRSCPSLQLRWWDMARHRPPWKHLRYPGMMGRHWEACFSFVNARVTCKKRRWNWNLQEHCCDSIYEWAAILCGSLCIIAANRFGRAMLAGAQSSHNQDWIPASKPFLSHNGAMYRSHFDTEGLGRWDAGWSPDSQV